MAITAKKALAVAKKYTDETVEGGGALKGVPCKVTDTTRRGTVGGKDGTYIDLQWELNDGTVKTGYCFVPDGDTGPKGDKGDKGDTGAEGAKGDTGATGEQGPKGDKGDTGSQGPKGETGDEGPKGDKGDTGKGISSIVADPNKPEITIYYDDGTHSEPIEIPTVEGNTTLESDVTSNTTVGAIASGTTLTEGTTFTEFAQKLLISEIAPTIAFSISKSGNVIYGDSYTETLTVNVSNMGTAKKISTIAWYEGDTLLQTDTIDSTTTGSWTYTMETATDDTTTFKAIVTYKKSNDANATTTKTSTISFYYKKFYGVVTSLTPSEADVETLTGVVGNAKGGTYTFTAVNQRIVYAYPASLGALTTIKDGNGFSLFNSFTRTTETYTQNGTSVSYYRYVLTDPTTVSGYSIQFA